MSALEVGPAAAGARVVPAELDELTLARARRGERAACVALVRRYEAPVFALLQRLLGRSGRAGLVEDLAQETFLRVFRALVRFASSGPAKLSTWILTIATRVGLDELRRHAPPTEALDAAGAAGVAAPERADDRAHRRAIGEEVARAAEALSPDLRATFLLRDVHELEYAEIAEATGADMGTVKSRLSRARAALRAALAEVHG